MALCRTSIREIEELFRALGAAPGQVVMVHSSLITLGYIERGLDGFYEALRRVIGPGGDIIVPTFTGSFRRNEVFDIRNSPAPTWLGAFAEYVRKHPHAVRSADPLFSMAAVGPRAEELMERTGHNCFGHGSIYEKIFDTDALLLALGITYSTGISAFMHLERLAGIDYRIEMTFRGRSIACDGVGYDDWAVHYARHEQRYPRGRTFRDALGARLEDRGISRGIKLGSGRHVGFHLRPFADHVLSELARDPHVMFVEDYTQASKPIQEELEK